MNEQQVRIPAWLAPLIVIGIAVPVIAAFALAGPALGMAVGALVAVAILVVAARLVPRGAIGGDAGGPRRLLIVAAVAIEDPESIRRIADEAHDPDLGETEEIRVLAPARGGFLDRWASDVGPAREAAQRNLVITLANLGKAQVEADARVGDEGLVQAVEDQLATYPATEVILVTGALEGDRAAARAGGELRGRLRVPFRHVVLPD
jgi:hypothetical protein